MARPHRPKGAWSDKAFRDALRIAVLEKHEGTTKLRKLAEQLVTAGLSGDVAAIKEVADRLDGKAKQQTDLTITDNRLVARLPEKAASDEEWAAEVAAVH